MIFPRFSHSPLLDPLFCFHLDVPSGPLSHTVLPHDYPFLFLTSSRLLHRMRFRSKRSPISPYHPSERSLILLLTIRCKVSPPFSYPSSFPFLIIPRNFSLSFLYHPSLSTYVTLSSRYAIYFSVAGFFCFNERSVLVCYHRPCPSTLARALSVDEFSR